MNFIERTYNYFFKGRRIDSGINIYTSDTLEYFYETYPNFPQKRKDQSKEQRTLVKKLKAPDITIRPLSNFRDIIQVNTTKFLYSKKFREILENSNEIAAKI